jgi:rhombotail lipoprotein
MEKVTRLFHVDVLILVSLNQVQFTDPKWYSWTYWTLVGAYTIKGDKNDTSTYVDGAVFHVPSHALLFRAEGTSTVKGSATWAQREAKLRERSMEGLTLATQELCRRLDEAVAAFKAEVVGGKRTGVLLVDKDGIPVGAPGYDPAKP